MKRHGRFVTLAVAMVLVVAACGGGDDEADGGNNDGRSTTQTPSGDNNDDNNNPGVVTTFLSNVPGLNDECTAVANLSIAFTQAFTGTFEQVPADIIDSLPAEARDEGQILADALEAFASGLQAEGIELNLLNGLGSLTPDQLEAYAEVSERVFTDEVEAAADRLGEAAVSCAPGAG